MCGHVVIAGTNSRGMNPLGAFPGMYSPATIVEMEPDIENMTLDEYREYEAEKERRLWDDVRFRRSLTYYNEADVDSFHRNKTPATKSILDKLLEEFRDETLNVTMVDEEADFNPTKDLEELERLLAKEPQPNFT
ncbi:hypothetical protein Tco_0394096 [Tanacetum coccineum]